MYCRQALNHSGGMFQELTSDGGLGLLENAWTFLATRFVASTRAAKSTMSDWRFRCSESSETIGSEWHFPLRYCVMGAVSPRDLFWSGRPAKDVSPLLPLANIVKLAHVGGAGDVRDRRV
jgi:hypothetical protein